MISAILPFVLAVVTGAAPKPVPAAVSSPEPAIKVSLNHATYTRGDRAKVNVRVRDDGYVVVLHTDATGHVRVLFPVDPGDDNFLKGGQNYEIRNRGDREAFQVTSAGAGTVYAAVSPDPYHFDAFVRNQHWDYGQLDDSALVDDPETGMTNLVEQMTNGQHFDYDVATYTSESTYASSQRAYIVPSSYSCFYNVYDPWCGGYYPSPSYFAVGIGFGFGGFYNNYGYGYPYGFGYPYAFGYPYGYGYGFGFPRYPIYGYGYYNRIPRYYGSTGYGYTVGRGWTYNNGPVILGPHGGYVGGRYTSRGGLLLGSTGSTIGYRNRGSFAVGANGASPLYGVSRFNTQSHSPSRGDNFGRRGISNGASSTPAFRQPVNGTRDDNGRRSSDGTGMRPATRSEPRSNASPTRAEPRTNQPERVQPRTNVDARPTRAEPRSDAPTRAEPRSQAPTRAEPRSQAPTRAEPRSEAPTRAEPRSEPRSSEPRSRAPDGGGARGGGGSHGGGGSPHGGGGGGGGGGRRGGGGGHRP